MNSFRLTHMFFQQTFIAFFLFFPKSHIFFYQHNLFWARLILIFHLSLLVRIWKTDCNQEWQLCFCPELLCESVWPFIFTLLLFYPPGEDVGLEKVENWEFVFEHWACLILADYWIVEFLSREYIINQIPREIFGLQITLEVISSQMVLIVGLDDIT